jgi:TrmH family RNA methyltransferase
MAESAAGEAWAAPLADWAGRAEARLSTVTDAVMTKLSSMANPPPAAAVLRQRRAVFPDVQRLVPPDTWIGIEGIRDPGNLGSIVRTADAAGAKGVILVGDCADPFSPEAVRASTGSIFAVPLVETSLSSLADWITGWPGLILGSAASGAVDYRAAIDRHPVLVLIGSEANGLSSRLTGLCHRLARIPMAGTAESLNAAIAAAVLLFEVRRPFLS